MARGAYRDDDDDDGGTNDNICSDAVAVCVLVTNILVYLKYRRREKIK